MNVVRNIRKRLQLSQEAFAKIAGVQQTTVSRWEHGEGEPSLSQITRILQFAGEILYPSDLIPGLA